MVSEDIKLLASDVKTELTNQLTNYVNKPTTLINLPVLYTNAAVTGASASLGAPILNGITFGSQFGPRVVLGLPGAVFDLTYQITQEGLIQGSVSSIASSALAFGAAAETAAVIGAAIAGGTIGLPAIAVGAGAFLVGSATKIAVDQIIDYGFKNQDQIRAAFEESIKTISDNLDNILKDVSAQTGKTVDEIKNFMQEHTRTINTAPDLGGLPSTRGLPINLDSLNPLIDKVSTDLFMIKTDVRGYMLPTSPLMSPIGDTGEIPASQGVGQTLSHMDQFLMDEQARYENYRRRLKRKLERLEHKGGLGRIITSIVGGVLGIIALPFLLPTTAGGAASLGVKAIIFNLPPLALDLDGDGIETISLDKSKAAFDMQGSGFLSKTSWISKDDALLAIDWNQNGIIDDVNETFGYLDTTGFTELKNLDSNGDNLIDMNDTFFNLLRVWQDANEDAVTDAGELKTLAQANVKSLGLNAKTENYYNNGNLVTESATYTKTDNSTAKLYDVVFNVSTAYTQAKGDYNVSVELLNLPWVRGYGLVKDLLVEAANNSTLATLLQNLYLEPNALSIYNQIDALISTWVGVGTIGANAPGTTDPEKVNFLEKFLNLDFAQDILDNANAAVVEKAYTDLKNKIFLDFVAQTPIGIGLGLNYNFTTDQHTVSTVFYDRILENLTDTKTGYVAYIIAQTLLSAESVDLGLLVDSIQRHGYGDFLQNYLNQLNTFFTGNASITGDASDNLIYSTSTAAAGVTLTGNDGNDVLISTVGTDTLQGGNGNDVYILDLQSGTDTILDAAGTDQLILGTGFTKDNIVFSKSSNDLTLSLGGSAVATIQNFYTTGSLEKISFIDGSFFTNTQIQAMSTTINGTASADTLVGNNFANTLLGNGANDTIFGGAGNDTLDGGSGTDSLLGGMGDDTYINLSSTDVIVENPFEGTDTVQSGATFTLPDNVENITLTGSSNVSATGNALDNVLTANAGTNTLTGGLGNDTYIIDSLDTVVENADAGNDTVQANFSYTLGANVENLTLTGVSAITGTGNSLNNLITGNNAASTLVGGAGNDTYIVQNTGTVITENASEGTDTVQASVNHTLGSNIENLILTGTSALSGTGNSSDNVITGNDSASTLSGSTGNDTYIVQNTNTVVVENSGSGTADTVQSSVTYTLGNNIENLTLTGNNAIDGNGNASNNLLTGNSANNILDGKSGNDTMVGGLGDDTYLVKEAGDVVVENAGEGTDTAQIYLDYTLPNYIENITISSGASRTATGNALDNILTGNAVANSTLVGGLGNDTYVLNHATVSITENANEGIDTVQSRYTHTLAANVENLTLTGTNAITGTGNSLDNIITGNTAIDTLVGGTGNDTYIIQHSNTVITENASEGTDTVQSAVTYTLGNNIENLTLTGTNAINGTGNSLNNVITGNAANNILSGGTGADTLLGGLGDDTYVVDNTGDVIVENASEGVDTVQASITYSLADFVENITLTGASTLNAFGTLYHNQMTGNTAANLLKGYAGNDTLDGGSGADSLYGGQGDDLFIVDNAGDVVVETINEGNDTVQSSISHTLASNVENLTFTGSSALTGTGNSLNNTFTGNTGIDTLIGGLGDDTYILNNVSTVITENASEGTDTVQVGSSYTLGSNLENLTLTGASALTGTGNSLNNVLTANNAASTLVGGLGNDTYIVWNSNTVITESAGEGTDTVQASMSYTLGTNIENAILTGTADINLTGNASNNILTGNTGDNVLEGGTGADTLTGGTGNDTYGVDNTLDVIVENQGEGVDTVQSSISHTLSTYLENLTLTGTAAINGIGNDYQNVLTGNSASNTLTGLGGNDTLDGGSGADILIGGIGDDTYLVDHTGDVVSENTNEGTDLVKANVTYTLGANTEYLMFTGNSSINGTGNTLNNWLMGNSAANSLTGLDGNDTLDGGTGADTLIGGIGDDTYLVDDAGDVITENWNEGLDTVQSSITYTLGNNLENLTLTGINSINGTGNASDNLLVGNTRSNTLTGNGGNDTLDGGVGADSLVGGTGHDTYIVDNTGDVLTENTNEGVDTVQASISYTLGANVENLQLTGSTAINATGNTLNNILTGNSSDNILDGGSGVDILSGGTGNDTYIVDNSGDAVIEQNGEGTDTVQSSITYTLVSDVENLTLLAGSGAISGTGNSLNNVLMGNESANTLTGLGGNDTLDGGIGADTLVGGTGNDTYIIDNASDVITENASEGTDTVQSSLNYTLGSNLENLTLTGSSALTGTGNSGDNILTGNSGNSTLIGGLGNDTYVVQTSGTVITENASEGTDTVQASLNWTLGSNLENLTLTGTFGLTGTGNTLNNVLAGNSGDNTLDGGSGVDTLIGGLGNDTYVVDNASDVITENANEGSDTAQASTSYTLGSNVENLTLTGGSALTGTGNSLDNVITGNNAASTLVGGLGNDTYIIQNAATVITENASAGTDTVQSVVSYTLGANIENLTLTGAVTLSGTGNSLDNVLTANDATSTLAGGLGNDTYVVQNAGTVLTENASEGTDTVQASISWTLGSNLEHLTLTGTNVMNGTGNTLNNSLIGNTGNNTLTTLDGNDSLDGGGGIDTLIGGLGNDTYFVNNSGNTLTENVGEGTDTVQASINYTLDANIENLTLTGTSALNGTGNSLDNTLTGNSLDNFLDGASGADTLVGGTGNDTYVVDNASDVVTENANEGTDTVQSSINYTLGSNLENLTLTGASALTGTGNSGNNILTGNTGNSTLVGGLGNDTYVVQASGTVLTENASEGTDTVQSSINWTLGSNLENLTLTGTTALTGTGNSLDNIITGNSAIDTLVGGLGNDTYVIQNSDTVITENTSEGTDAVQSSVSYTLGNNLENLALTGADTTNGTGNTLNNQLTGNAASNTLVGLDGNDTLDGAAGIDTLYGGLGNDTYIFDNLSDIAVENSGEGTDTVQTSVSTTLGANIETLTLTGTSGITGTGNSLNNTIIGNTGDNILDGASGADTLIGGTGNDTYMIDNSSDVITENASEGTDTAQASVSYTLSSNVENLTLTGNAALTATGNSGNNILTGNLGNSTLIGGLGNDTYVLQTSNTTVTENLNEGTDTVQAGFNYTLGNNLENLLLTGTENLTGTGNSLNNTLTGNSGNNTLDGGSGSDTLIGGIGNDTYIVDNVSDVITENSGEGIDLVQSSVTYTLSSFVENITLTGSSNINATGNTFSNYITGNTGANSLSGGAGNDTLDGGLGADTLVGGTGDDTYVIDNVGDILTENSGEGIDTVQSSINWTLASYFENLTLTGTTATNGTGNNFANLIIGNSTNNNLNGGTGNDTLDGGAGADSLIGGLGDDTFIVDNLNDIVVENAGEGTDIVQSSINYTLSANIENLILTNNNAINGTGNSRDNVVIGNSANNLLDGDLGSDSLLGGAGNDTYIVDNMGDLVIENTNEGIDTVQSSISYVLGNNLEHLILTGTGDLNGTGNTLDNQILGNSGDNLLDSGDGNDTLDGGIGSDTMIGGLGNDTYVINTLTDEIIENANEGIDTVQSGITYTLSSNFENLTLTGTGAINGTGNTLNNVLMGNIGNNILDGGSGNDTYVFGYYQGIDTISDSSGSDTLDLSQLLHNVSLDLNANSYTAPTTGMAMPLFTAADGSNSIGDQFGNTWTAYGNAVIGSTNSWKAGEKYISLDGNGDYIATSSVDLTSNNWTVHWRQKFNAVSGGYELLKGTHIYSLQVELAAGKLVFYNSSNGTSWDITTAAGFEGITSITTGRWYDLELSYSSTAGYKLFLDGNLEIGTSITTKGYASGGLIFGAYYNGAYGVNGQLADVYLTNNQVLHSTNFTPSTDTVLTNYGNATQINWSANSLENVIGGVGNDTLIGTSADNSLTGNSGNDSLIGGAGNDIYRFLSNFEADTINDSSGSDTFDFSAFGTAINLNLANTSFTESTGNTVSWSSNAVENLTTGSGNDNLTGSSLDNTLIANDGSDTLAGGAGNDSLNGGSGSDIYVFGTGFGLDTIVDASGTDILNFSAFTTGLSISLANNSYTQSAGNTVSWDTDSMEGLVGGSGNDTLTGNNNSNILDGRGGNDSLVGGDANDTYLFYTGFGLDTITDSSGTDTLDFSSLSGNLSVNLNNTSFTESAGNTVSWTANSIEDLFTGSGNDTLTGSSGNNRLMGCGGNDSLIGGDGNDTYVFSTGFGLDTISDSSGSDTLDLSNLATGITVSLTTTSFTYSTGNTINWTSGALENITSSSGNDSLTGSTGSNTLAAGNGNDTLVGSTGTDTLNGGDGNDTYTFTSGGFDTTTLTDSSGSDTLDLSTFTSALSIDLTATSYTQSAGHTISWTSNTLENINTGTGNDTLTGNSLDNILMAGLGADTLTGGAGNDSLVGSDGNDTYSFGAGFGLDTITDSAGTDLIDFSAFTSDITLDLSTGAYTQSTGNSLFWTGSNLENITAGSGNDVLTGNSLDNNLVGGLGNDTLNGGLGQDTLNGGAGDDVYRFQYGSNVKTIADSSGIDTLDVSAYTANLSVNLSNSSTTLPFSPMVSNQKALLTLNAQSNGSTILPDAYGNSWYTYGNSTVQNSNSWKTGEKYVQLDGIGDTIQTDSVVLNSNNYSIHWRQRFDAFNDIQVMVANSNYGFELQYNTGILQLYLTSQNGTNFDLGHVNGSKSNWVQGQWYDFQLNYSSTVGYKLYVDGVQDLYHSSTTTVRSGSVVLGGQFNGGDSGLSNPYHLRGAIADVYVTNTETLNTGNFTPSTDSFASQFSQTVDWTGSMLENLISGTGNDTLTGNSSANLMKGDAGNDTLSGGTGNDIYQFSKGDGLDLITENDSTMGNIDKILLDSSIAQSTVALYMNSGSLEIGYTDSTDKITVQNQTTTANTVERIELSNGNYMTDANITQLISDLSAYASSHSLSFTSLNDVKNSSELMALINAAWHA